MTAPKKIENPSESHVADLKLISAALWDEKDSRGWCSDFERLVREFNRKLRVDLPNPDGKITAKFAPMFEVEIPYDESKTRPENRDDAENMLHTLTGQGAEAILAYLATAKIKRSYGYGLDIRARGGSAS